MKNKVSFNNVDREEKKNRPGEETWITVQWKTMKIVKVKCTSHFDRGPQNTATRNLGTIQHLIKVLFLLFSVPKLMYRKFAFQLVSLIINATMLILKNL